MVVSTIDVAGLEDLDSVARKYGNLQLHSKEIRGSRRATDQGTPTSFLAYMLLGDRMPNSPTCYQIFVKLPSGQTAH